jgi:YycE-like protein
MYERGLGLSVLGQFTDHDGFDGMILGREGEAYHLEFTATRGRSFGRSPSDDHLLVFYTEGGADWDAACTAMLRAGFRVVKSANPYWDVSGRTFEDIEGYRVVLQGEAWKVDR